MRADFLVEATAQGLLAHGRTAADLVGLFEASGYRAWEIENRYDVDAYLDARPPPPRPLTTRAGGSCQVAREVMR